MKALTFVGVYVGVCALIAYLDFNVFRWSAGPLLHYECDVCRNWIVVGHCTRWITALTSVVCGGAFWYLIWTIIRGEYE